MTINYQEWLKLKYIQEMPEKMEIMYSIRPSANNNNRKGLWICAE